MKILTELVDNFSDKECFIKKMSFMELFSLCRTETFEIKRTDQNILLITSRHKGVAWGIS